MTVRKRQEEPGLLGADTGNGNCDDPYSVLTSVRLRALFDVPEDDALSGSVVRLPGDVLPDLAAKVVRDMVADFKRPEYRAGFVAGMVVSGILMRQGMRMLPACFIGALGAVSVEKLYVMAADVHETAIAQREYLEQIAEGKHSAAGQV